MKNIKNIAATLTLTATLAIGATVANAGVIFHDRAESDNQCTATKIGIFKNFTGSLISVFPGLNGILISDRTERNGILISDKPCQTEGILISD